MILSHDAIQINNHLMSYNNSLIADHANIKPELPYYYATVWENGWSTAKNDAGLYNYWRAIPLNVHSFNIVCEFDNALNIDSTFTGLVEQTLSSIMDSQSGENTCFANVTAANSAFMGISFNNGVMSSLFEKSYNWNKLKEANSMFYTHGNKMPEDERYVFIPDNSFNNLKEANHMFDMNAIQLAMHIGNNCFNSITYLGEDMFGRNVYTEIGDNCFNKVTAIDGSFGTLSMSAIGDNCFNSLTSATKFIPTNTTELSIGNSFKNLRIANGTFNNIPRLNFNLKNLNLLENGNNAFDGDSQWSYELKTTDLPSLTAGNGMFNQCYNLRGDVSAFIQANSARIIEHNGMFRDCNSLDGFYQLKDNPEYSDWF